MSGMGSAMEAQETPEEKEMCEVIAKVFLQYQVCAAILMIPRERGLALHTVNADDGRGADFVKNAIASLEFLAIGPDGKISHGTRQ